MPESWKDAEIVFVVEELPEFMKLFPTLTNDHIKEHLIDYYGYKNATFANSLKGLSKDKIVINVHIVQNQNGYTQWFRERTISNGLITLIITMRQIDFVCFAGPDVVGASPNKYPSIIHEWIKKKHNEMLKSKAETVPEPSKAEPVPEPSKAEPVPEPSKAEQSTQQYDWSKHDFTKFNEFAEKDDISLITKLDKDYLARSKILKQVYSNIKFLVNDQLDSYCEVFTFRNDLYIDCCNFFGCQCIVKDDSIIMHL